MKYRQTNFKIYDLSLTKNHKQYLPLCTLRSVCRLHNLFAYAIFPVIIRSSCNNSLSFNFISFSLSMRNNKTVALCDGVTKKT